MAKEPGAKLNVTRCYKNIGTRHNKDIGEKAKPCRMTGPDLVR